MAHSYVSILIHYIFSTKNREKIISREIQDRVWAYMGGIARENKMKALSIGGVEEHAHALLSLPSTISIAKDIQLIKGGSSKWISDTFPSLKDFTWQVGYGAFSVSISHVDETINYIKNQKEHHRHKTFQEEYLAFLKFCSVVPDGTPLRCLIFFPRNKFLDYCQSSLWDKMGT